MSTTAATPAAALSMPKPRPYRRYLTSALHTRFVHAVLLALLNSLFISFWTGKDYFWSWFPFGPAGLKAALFSMSSLFVFFLQLATMNTGRRTSVSLSVALRGLLFDATTYQIMFWYIVSAWWFCEAYIWAVPEYYILGWVIRGDHSHPDRLNERPIYLRFFFSVLALVQSGVHIYYGQSFLHIPVSKPSTSQSAEVQTHPVGSVQTQLRKLLPVLCTRSVFASGLATVLAPFIYRPFFRSLFWRAHLAFAKPLFNLSRADASPPDKYFIGSILGWAFFAGIGLTCTWELAAHSFLIYLKQAPVKSGLPLSAGSKDPNGTLLNGLVAKRKLVKTFAFWELALIAQRYPDRRKAIFADFERENGPMWTSMLKASLSVLSDIDSRILELNPEPSQPAQVQNTVQIQSLPRITKQASNKPVFAPFPPPSTRTQKVENFLALTNKTIGQSSNPWSPPIKDTQQRLLEYAKPVVDPRENDLWKRLTNATKSSSLSGLIGTKSARKVSSVVLGNPAGNAAIIVDATEGISKMLVASLNEDDFGKAVQTVPESVKQFSRTIMLIESYVKASVQTQTAEDEQELQEVAIVVGRMKAALRELLAAFQVFLNDAGLSIKDLNEARRATEDRLLLPKPRAPIPNSQRPEMEQVGKSNERQLGSSDNRHKEPDTREQRARETAQSLRRIEAQPRRQRVFGSEENVFRARNLGSGADRPLREFGGVR